MSAASSNENNVHFLFFVEYIIDKITGIIYLGDDMNIKIFIKKQERFC